MMNRRLVLLLLLLSWLPAACRDQPPADPAAASRRHTRPAFDSSPLGLQFDLPAGWVAGPAESDVVAAPEAPTGPAGAGPSIQFGLRPDGRYSPDTLLELARESYGLLHNRTVISPTMTTTINGHPALLAVDAGQRDGQPVSAIYAAVDGDGQDLYAIALTPDLARDEALLLDVIYSIRLSLPSPFRAGVLQGQIWLGETVHAAVEANEPAAWWFDGVAGEVLWVTAEPLAEEFDLVIDLLAADGRSLLDSPRDNFYGTEEIGPLQLTADGRYYAVVWGYRGAAGPFALTVEPALSEATGPLADDRMPRLTSDTAYYGQLAENGHLDLALAGQPGRPVRIIVDGDEEMDAVITIYDPRGRAVARQDEAFEGESESLAFTLLEEGWYVVRVTEFYDAGGAYTIGLVALEDNPATRLQTEGFVPPDGFDEHAVVAAAGQALLIIADPSAELDVMIEVLSDGDVLEQRDDLIDGQDDTETHIFVAPATGEYTIRLKGFGGTTGSYRLTVAVVPLQPVPASGR